jgi:hypothetical protein
LVFKKITGLQALDPGQESAKSLIHIQIYRIRISNTELMDCGVLSDISQKNILPDLTEPFRVSQDHPPSCVVFYVIFSDLSYFFVHPFMFLFLVSVSGV